MRESFERQVKSKAPGVDGIRKEDYGVGLEERLVKLSDRLRRLGYLPKPARRVYIPKGDGRTRPLGIPSFEDRLVQDRLSAIIRRATQHWRSPRLRRESRKSLTTSTCSQHPRLMTTSACEWHVRSMATAICQNMRLIRRGLSELWSRTVT